MKLASVVECVVDSNIDKAGAGPAACRDLACGNVKTTSSFRLQ